MIPKFQWAEYSERWDMLVNEDRVSKAMGFLAESDLQIANLKGNMKRTEYLAEVAESLAYKAMGGDGSVEDRKKAAKVAQPTQEAWETHFKSVVDYEALRARREREVLVVELWRTESANRRQGNVT